MQINWSLFITIGLIFLVTLLGAYLRSRFRDRCLKDFVGFHVTIERTNDKLIWGILSLEATGLELSYTDAMQDEKHIESSYVLYASEYQGVQAIYRYADKLSAWGRRKRERDIRHSFHPNLLRRLARSVRNFLSTATDSLQEVMTLLLGQFQKAGSRYLADRTDVMLNKLGGKYIGEIGRQADPLLENYIGHRVVFEITEGDEIHEHVGVFKDYSAQFVEFLDVQYPQVQILPMRLNQDMQTERVQVRAQAGMLQVKNLGDEPLLLQSLHWDQQEQLLNVVVDGGETVELHPTQEFSRADLRMQIARELDMIVPRSHCIVRHRAEFYKPDDFKDVMFDVIFDLGTALTGSSLRDAREQRLREELANNPHDALTATNLAGILIQKEAYDEAEQLLSAAVAADQSLPDGGRRARMQLRELARRRSGAPIVQPIVGDAAVAEIGEFCVVCNEPIKGIGRMLGGRGYCEKHYRRVLQGHSGAWRATLGLIAGLFVFVGVVSLLASAVAGALQGIALVAAGLILAAVPAGIWLLVFYQQDRLEPEPKRLVLGVFVLGAVLASTIGQPLIGGFFRVNAWADFSVWTKLAADILIVGALQAFLIYAAVRYTVFRSDEFDEPVDGIIYGAAAGLGYATMLNISYIVSHGGVDLGVGALRVAVVALAYASFGGVLGYFLGQAKFAGYGPFWLPLGVLATSVLNGLVTVALSLVSRTGLQATPIRGLVLVAAIAGVTFVLLFVFMRRSNYEAVTRRER
jgi:RsiW-degrading membrane proteinase PrsW (M82 family)